MDLTPLITSDRMVVQSYGAVGIKVSGTLYENHIVIFPDHVEAWDGDYASLVQYKDSVDVMLIGTGAKLTLLPREKRQALKNQGLHIDLMDTGAACRTYNVLMAEGRRVAAALLKP